MDTSIEVIWNTFNHRLGRFIRSRVDDRQVADDLLQDVYVKIHTHIDGLRAEDRLQAWVYQIARNTIYDYYRGLKPFDEITEAVALPEDAEEPDEITEQLAYAVRSMIEYLPDEYREALILTEIKGLTQKELAERLGISVSGAKSRVQRGRKLLREMLLRCSHFQFDRRGKVIDYYPHCGCCSPNGCAN